MDRLSRVATLSGLAFAILFGLGSGLWALEQPERDAGTSEVLAFFEDTSVEILVGGTISLVSLVFLVWFGAAIREHLLAAEGARRSGLPLAAFAGTVLLAAAGLGAETVNMAGALSAEDGQLTAEGAQLYFDLSYAFGAHAAGVAIAMVALPIGLSALTTGRVVPRWAGWAALLFGITMLTPAILNRAAFLVLYTLTVLFSAALSIHLHKTTIRGDAGKQRATYRGHHP